MWPWGQTGENCLDWNHHVGVQINRAVLGVMVNTGDGIQNDISQVYWQSICWKEGIKPCLTRIWEMSSMAKYNVAQEQ